MAQGKVMITGATGFLGSSFLIHLLKSGYTAHIVVRSEAKAKSLQEAPAITVLNKSAACKYFVVPDLAAPGALDEATAGTDYVIHCAAPLPFGSHEGDFVSTTIACTLSALESARHAATVKRVVLLSSIAAFTSPELAAGDAEPADEVVLRDQPSLTYDAPPYPDLLFAYCAAKTAAQCKAAEWVQGQAAQDGGGGGGIGLDVVSLAPCYVFGRHPLVESVADLMQSSNGILLRVIVPGAGTPGPGKMLAGGVSLRDVVKTVHMSLDMEHVKTPESGPSKGFSACVMGLVFPLNDALPIVGRKWPEEVERGLLTDKGDWPSKKNIRIGLDKFHETFGFEHAVLEDMLDDLVPQYLELAETDRKSAGKAA